MTSNFTRRVAANVETERAHIRGGLTVKGLADQAGMSYTSLRRKLAADYPFDTDELAALADVLDCTPRQLACGRRRIPPDGHPLKDMT